MTRLSQLIERNRRHSESPYILLLEAALPSGVTLRFARDPQSWVWPLAGSGHSQFTFPGDSVQYTTTNKITVSIFGRWKGTIGLDALQPDGTWKEYTTYLQRIEESHDLPDGTYRLQARADFSRKGDGMDRRSVPAPLASYELRFRRFQEWRRRTARHAHDQLLNTLLGGWPDETLSSRCYRWARDGVRTWPCKFVDGLFFWQKEHCKSSYESEKEGRQSPPELRPLSAELAGQ